MEAYAVLRGDRRRRAASLHLRISERRRGASTPVRGWGMRKAPTEAQKLFIAHYRYPAEDGIGPADYFIYVQASSLAEAKRVAKGYEGRHDKAKWLMGVEREEVAA